MVCKGELLVNNAVSRIQNPSTRMIMYCLSIFTFTLDNIGLSLCIRAESEIKFDE